MKLLNVKERTLILKGLEVFKRSLPPDLRKFYLYHNNMMAHLEAIAHYRPQPIPYPVTLINTTLFDKTRLSDYKKLWSELAPKEIEYHIIEGVHNPAHHGRKTP